ncbi:anthranilate synthase component I family protein [Acetobacter pasteurianus]|uniref:Para-aminobenzoate synthase component I n=3 Tax=Acetobacter pasteurianus TaxID=438 RepID=C7JD60_ACEP3|nr:anthranilate synthase component I family protein [Acetobacter pasteurianus]ASC06348.1 Aminodeoxychorismate synthase [Acetobacter pasteurianus subsp. pasteurianus]BAI00072.1 para-aminobenzoate synthase component I [Acetobacter pasteurianus IFO 3283-01]BAI03125.1 para-aminobenzoate synthase component I [Acetobacter pasteurianus IFO 3283-03]BAI06170.1 para-aminobenzoate synthase component I [Acetobacter pasteurianus IFO 3283-07]BAI09220.1 para-aminobenzoate synthase component I [Acetobacter pa
MVQIQELQWKDPDAVLSVWGQQPWCAFLDSGGKIDNRSRWQIFCHKPCHTVVAWPHEIEVDGISKPTVSVYDIFEILRIFYNELKEKADGTRLQDIPFWGGLVGFASYQIGMMLEGVLSRHKDQHTPLLAAGVYDHAFIWDRFEKRVFLAGISKFFADDVNIAQLIRAWNMLPEHVPSYKIHTTMQFVADQSRKAYCQNVAQTRDYIAAGDIFQANITCRHTAEVDASVPSAQVYRALRQQIPAPFGAYLSCGPDFALLSSSPERFLRVDANGCVSSRPIKGTAPRGQTPEEDAFWHKTLLHDEKERAENLMIVDLMRHDIGRMAQIGSVCVPDLLVVEQFPHVHHLVSEVRGKLLPNKDVFDLLKVTLPPGSVTGAPKYRAMQIIDELEASARGAYCGTVFRIGGDDSMDSSVIIRSLERSKSHLSIGVGGGVTILSDPEKEYEEMRLKFAPFQKFWG